MTGTARDDIIIHQPWGGLGDNLAFSTLPELYAQRGHKVFISSRNAAHNPEIFDLVWGQNPYIAGLSDAEPNAGAMLANIWSTLPRYTDFIRRIEQAHGLPPTNDYPKLYYKPKFREELANTVLVDVDSNTVESTQQLIWSYLSYVFGHFGYQFVDARQVTFEKRVARQSFPVQEFQPIVVKDIKDFCDIIYSCRVFVTVHSGAHSMAVSLRGARPNPIMHCYCPGWKYNMRDYIYPRVEYYVA